MITPKITIAEQIAELEREIKIRERVYARWVDTGKLTKRAADLQLDRMRAAVETLKRAMVDLSDRAPGKMPTGESFGPARAREVERAKVLNTLANMIDSHTMYKLVAALQEADSGIPLGRSANRTK